MTWTTDDLRRIGDGSELRISSRRPDGTLRRWTPIWVVRVGDELYIRSAFGTEGAWYRNAMRHRHARIQAGGVEADVALEPVADEATNADIDSAYRSKYRGQDTGLQPMLTPTAAATSVRLVPAPSTAS